MHHLEPKWPYVLIGVWAFFCLEFIWVWLADSSQFYHQTFIYGESTNQPFLRRWGNTRQIHEGFINFWPKIKGFHQWCHISPDLFRPAISPESPSKWGMLLTTSWDPFPPRSAMIHPPVNSWVYMETSQVSYTSSGNTSLQESKSHLQRFHLAPNQLLWLQDLRFILKDRPDGKLLAEGRIGLAEHLPWVSDPSKARPGGGKGKCPPI